MTLKGLLDNGWFVRVILVLWLVSAVFVVFLLGKVDWIVHHELYNYGLQFSPEWAVDYWAALRMMYVSMSAPIVLSVIYFGFEVWHFVRSRRGMVESKPAQPAVQSSQKVAAFEQNHMVVSCPKCKRVFSKPLVMLDFSGGKTRLVNVCPYCNNVLGCAEGEAEKRSKDGAVDFVDLNGRKVEQK